MTIRAPNAAPPGDPSALDALVEAIATASRWNDAVEARPAALLWCDPKGECAPLLPSLRTRLPHLLSFGAFDPETRTGPAIWLRAAAAGAWPDVTFGPGAVPVVWAPEIGRDQLRGTEGTPPALAPLVWLAITGNVWGHRNGRDWTLRALLQSALKLDIAEDGATRLALARAAPRLLARPLSEIGQRRWDADALDGLLTPDLDADLLDWIDGTLDAVTDPERFAAFAGKAQREFGFDPSTQSRDAAAQRLAERSGAWGRLWDRFGKSHGYAGVVHLLMVREPPADFLADTSAYPRANERGEDQLRNALNGLSALDLPAARARILELEDAHGLRRGSVWAQRGLAPLACALEHLAAIARAAALPGDGAAPLAGAYVSSGWRVDRAALAAIAAAPREVDRAGVVAALLAIYRPWVEDGACALQAIARRGALPFAQPAAFDSDCDTLIFVDGLRFDLAAELHARLTLSGVEATLGWRWSGWPTVTATCKPLATPVAEQLCTGPADPAFRPLLPSGKPADKAGVDALMRGAGWVIGGFPLGGERCFIETGTVDEDGHKLGARLADTIERALDDALGVVLTHVRAGRSVRVVTDHGWLLMPDGLETAALPAGLVEPDGKRTRCALVKEGAEVGLPRIPWTWNGDIHVAAASGARSFYKGYEYAHGGISPQECVLPVLDIGAGSARRQARVAEAEWTGLRVRITVEDGGEQIVDLCAENGASLLPARRGLNAEGKASLVVRDDHEGKRARIVVLDDEGLELAERWTVIGGAE
ncbi:BREX-1 system phosphatase PglZ type B [Altererythrobacter sp. TH136]|uniref:BREX-1 system phosphatase PglZ type B n=1 Tax=Altererythrobacter sp. TH136 TaxID=2067415 RepID=UPI00143DF072|nr:BREX-1 system phosphatase PglZ type B [Altererythrobacter sp. TH136]